jgi:hypothetical protein
MDVYYKRNEELTSIVDAFEQDDDDAPLYKKMKMTNLGFNAGQSTRRVDDIVERKRFLQEDGDVDVLEKDDDAEKLKNKYKEKFGKNYNDEVVTRLGILERNPDYRWVTVLAGAMGRSAHELYEEEDIDRKKMEMEWNRQRMKLEYERMVLPTEKKKEQLLFLRGERNGLERMLFEKESDVAFADLNNNAETLINDTLAASGETKRTIFDLYLAQLDLKILSDLIGQTGKWNADDLERDRVIKVLGLDKNIVVTPEMREQYIFIILFRYFLDASRKGQNLYYIVQRIIENMATVKSSFKITESLHVNGFVKPNESNTVDMTIFKTMFPTLPDGIKTQIWQQGLGLVLGSNNTNSKNTEKFTLNPGSASQQLFDDVKSIPELIEMTKKLTTSKDLGEFLESHFIWVALKDMIKNKKIDDIATKVSKGNTVKIQYITMPLANLKIFIPKVNAYLSRYFKEMYLLLTQSQPIIINTPPSNNTTTTTTTTTTGNVTKKTVTAPTPPVPTSSQQQQPRLSIFQFPPYMMTAFPIDVFETQNFALIDKNLDDFIVYEPFKKYYDVEKPTLDAYFEKRFPIFRLESMFTSYTTFARKERKKIGQRIREIDGTMEKIETKIKLIAEENGDFKFLADQDLPYVKQPRTFNSQPINNGIIRLKAEVVTFMMKAWTRVQQYCPRLRGLPLQAFQDDSAFEVGLTVEFANFVAALIAENQLTFPNAYKSLAMQRHVISHCANVMNQLKYYTYSAASVGYTIRREDLKKIQSRHTMLTF